MLDGRSRHPDCRLDCVRTHRVCPPILKCYLETVARFHKTLTALRTEAGFATPYAFYHRNGGPHVFPFTFTYYVKLEKGKHLPRAEWLPLLLTLLRIPPTDEHHRRFVTDYLRDLFVTDENYASLVAPLLAPAAGVKPAQQTVKRLLSEQAYHLTPAQYKALLSSPESYWAFECLVNDRASFSAGELAAATGLPAPRLEAALRLLKSHRLVRPASKGRWRSPLAGKFYVFPRHFPGIEAQRKRLQRYLDAMQKAKGASFHESGVMIRAGAGDVHRAVGGFRDAIEAATAYSVYDKTDDSGLFLLQIRARKFLDF